MNKNENRISPNLKLKQFHLDLGFGVSSVEQEFTWKRKRFLSWQTSSKYQQTKSSPSRCLLTVWQFFYQKQWTKVRKEITLPDNVEMTKKDEKLRKWWVKMMAMQLIIIDWMFGICSPFFKQFFLLFIQLFLFTKIMVTMRIS